MPVLVLLREPGDAIRSFLQRDPDLNPDWALRRWTRFYRVVEQVADHVVIATFEQTTGDFGRVVQRLNARFGTVFHHGPTDEALFRQVTGAMSKSSMPDPERRKGLAAIAVDLDPQRLAVARSLYERLAAMALATETTG